MNKPAQSYNVQVRLTTEQLAWMQTLGTGSAPAGIRRLLEIVAQESQPDPLATLGALLGRAAAVHALISRSHPAPQTLAGSTAAPGQQQPPSVVVAQVSTAVTAPTQQPATTTELTGFEGWDE